MKTSTPNLTWKRWGRFIVFIPLNTCMLNLVFVMQRYTDLNRNGAIMDSSGFAFSATLAILSALSIVIIELAHIAVVDEFQKNQLLSLERLTSEEAERLGAHGTLSAFGFAIAYFASAYFLGDNAILMTFWDILRKVCINAYIGILCSSFVFAIAAHTLRHRRQKLGLEEKLFDSKAEFRDDVGEYRKFIALWP